MPWSFIYLQDMKIYTKTGDKGETGYIGGRTSKSNLLFDVLGTLDELNSVLGIACAKAVKKKYLQKEILKIQSDIFAMGGIFAGSKIVFSFKNETKILEQSVDLMEKGLVPLKNFILPGGSILGAYLHHARSICRKAERAIIIFESSKDLKVLRKTGYNPQNILFSEVKIYINRLSDWLFVAARWENKRRNAKETLWKV